MNNTNTSQKDTVQNTQITFAEWEKTIDKTQKVLIIPNYLLFEDDKLVINEKDYPNLETLYANSCALKHVEIIALNYKDYH